jgi:hypothetical protein
MNKTTFEAMMAGLTVLFLVLYMMRRRSRRKNLLQ